MAPGPGRLARPLALQDFDLHNPHSAFNPAPKPVGILPNTAGLPGFHSQITIHYSRLSHTPIRPDNLRRRTAASTPRQFTAEDRRLHAQTIYGGGPLPPRFTSHASRVTPLLTPRHRHRLDGRHSFHQNAISAKGCRLRFRFALPECDNLRGGFRRRDHYGQRHIEPV